MKKTILFILISTVCAAGIPENLRFKQFGTPIPARSDLDVRWNAPANAFPRKIWFYRLLPNQFSPKIVSNLMEVCSFTDKDRVEWSTNAMFFQSADKQRRLRIFFPLGVIHYEATFKFDPTNLTKDVPNEKRALKLTKKLLPKLGLSVSDIDNEDNGSGPRLICSDSEITYFVKAARITNIIWRRVAFRRSVDGISFVGSGTGGDCDIHFGSHGKVVSIDLSWRNLEREQSYPTVTPTAVMNSIREGKAVQGWLRSDSPGIDWPTAKSVTIKGAWPRYYAGDPFSPSDWLYPFVALSTSVDTGRANVNVEIDCPIIDETKPLESNH